MTPPLHPGIYRILVATRVGVESDSATAEPDSSAASEGSAAPDGSVAPDGGEPSSTEPVSGAEAPSGVQRQYLTDAQSVTILPPSAYPDPKQEWRVDHGKDGNYIIGRPSDKWPSPFLTYEGAPKKPEPRNRVKIHIFDFPLNEWHLQYEHGGRYKIRVAGSKLGIGIGPELIFPPFLQLSLEQVDWVFEFVRPK